MRPLLIGLMLAVGLAPQVPGFAQTPAPPRVQLTFESGGLVTLVANEATVREVLAEWTRKGGTPFVGAEKLTGSAMTLQYEHRPETEVVNSLLRNASGVVIAPRDPASTGASSLGVVFVVATSNPTLGGYSTPTYTPQPQMSTSGSPDQEIPPVGPGRSGEPPQPAPPPPPRPAGVSGVAVPVVPVVPVTTPPTTTGGGRGGGGGGRR